MRSAAFALLALTLTLAAEASSAASLNNRPIVGILTQPTDGGLTRFGSKYVAASYVKYVEAAGCRAVPVFHNGTDAYLESTFKSINGLLFPGGGSDLVNTPLRRAAEKLFRLAKAANDAGDFFPIFGHCMGFELLAYMVSQDNDILEPVEAEGIPYALNFTPAAKTSRWLQGIDSNTFNILGSQAVTMNNHHWGVYTSTFAKNSNLNQFFRVISTNVGQNGHEFVSTWEGVKYPVYGMQWHAEKNQFEWNPAEDIPHFPDAISSMNWFSGFLGREARKSHHAYTTPKAAADALFYNYAPLYSEQIVADFEQCYVW